MQLLRIAATGFIFCHSAKDFFALKVQESKVNLVLAGFTKQHMGMPGIETVELSHLPNFKHKTLTFGTGGTQEDRGIAGCWVPRLFSAVANALGPEGKENNEKKVAF